MAFLKINPRYRQFVEQQQLTTAVGFLEMPSVIICGHPDRNVARVTLAAGSGALNGFLKREHRVAWKDRLLNALAGFGFVSKSCREATVLRTLQEAGVRCPDWIAVGEDDRGRAFLLLRELNGASDLRLFLQNQVGAEDSQRRQAARKLGEALAGFHNAGFNHPDLYSKHVLVSPGDMTVSFLDWQRSRQRRELRWRQRCRDLAALDATLADELATTRDRLVCLRAYVRKSRRGGDERQASLRNSALYIRRCAERLLRRRRIRELRRVPAACSTPELIWQDGESLCLTPAFRAQLAGRIPDWLVANFTQRPTGLVTHTWLDIPNAKRALLIRRRARHPLGGLWVWSGRRPPSSPEVRRAGLIFRLESCGIHAPRLLAFGQRPVSSWHIESFLLIEPPPGAVTLNEWLASRCSDLGARCRLIREAAGLLRQIHSLHCYLGGLLSFAVVQQNPQMVASVVLEKIDGLHSRRRPSKTEAWKDLAALRGEFSSTVSRRTDDLRLLLAYLGVRKCNVAVKRMARALGKSQNANCKMQIPNWQFAFYNLHFPLLEQRTPTDLDARAQGALP